MPKLPKKHDSHKNPSISYRQLRQIFGDNWNIGDPRDIDSGIEYGQDYLIEVVDDDGTVTAREFRVQSKVLTKEKSFTKYHIGDSLDVSTINYLLHLPVPVLIHFIDGRTDNYNGYVMWLNEWLGKNPKQTWEHQDTKKLNIPLQNKFNAAMMEMIENTIEDFYFRHSIRKQADLINKYSEDHKVELRFNDDTNEALTIIHAKHKKAIPVITPLDEDAMQSFKEIIEYGESNPRGRFSISNIPSGIIDDPSNLDFKDATFLPHLGNYPSLPMRIRLVDSQNKIHYTVNYLELKPTKLGTKQGKWSANIVESLISITLTHSFESSDGNWNFTSNTNNVKDNRPEVFLEYFKFLDACRNADSMEIEILKENRILHFDLPSTNEYNSPYKDALENIIYIKNVFNLDIIVPPQLSGQQMNHINTITDILKTGRLATLLPDQLNDEEIVLKVIANYEKAKETFTSVKEINEPIFIEHDKPIIATIFDEKINLGRYNLVLKNIEFQNEDEIIEKLEKNSQDIEIWFRFNNLESFTEFPDWL